MRVVSITVALCGLLAVASAAAFPPITDQLFVEHVERASTLEATREAFDFWAKTLERACEGAEVGSSARRIFSNGARRRWVPQDAPNSTSPLLQEYERRFETWMDNLKFVLDYNARHTTHWVRARPIAAAAPLRPSALSRPCL